MLDLFRRVTAWALQQRLVRAFLVYSGRRGPMLADSVTYRTLFSVFAGVLIGFSFAALWLAGNPDGLAALVRSVDSVIPGLVGPGGLVDVEKIEAPAGFTVAGILGSVGLIGAAIGAVGSLRSALRQVADVTTEDTLIVWVLLRNLALAIGIGVALVAAAGVTFLATAGLTVVRDWLGIPADSWATGILTWLVSTLVVLALDTAVVAVAFALLSGLRVRRATLLRGALLGGVGLVVLQQLSGLFVGGASSNPLLATFAALIALLLWLNLSSQVILLAGAYITVGHEEDEDRVRAKYAASTLVQFRVQRAERAVQAAVGELDAAREAEAKEREAIAKSTARG
ncbi:MAG: ribonuclease BN [Microbacterium sp. 71-36]|uniref:YhjD/YihY/BrkB family envelope integrity protein n=1 Tax=unclassified Microbacterium TaxID=2609290 RepID=UPI00086CC6D6|nr:MULTISPECIES: YhjD/YihY/BrkB family envelope integrity protein [unclassified Microbacterium]MBN9212287.1 YihY/virulence factor BrkB family protein [Microbacterium sp.]ODT38648.1 MAG: ribonuclease BN [Microbacterium sp. SCN 71-17]OJV75724.1 MAG: ribonuclease BN [Microbacterium sp. 71-36]